jgi:lipoprotein-anchoring transpeptidase ErfK/SrfK
MKQSALALLVASVAFIIPTFAHAFPEPVAVGETVKTGTIIVRKQERALYYIAGEGRALRYPVGIGRVMKRWVGAAYVTAKYADPSWIPSAKVRRDYPQLPPFIPGGAPENPMGVAALTVSGGRYLIHGTNHPYLIDRFFPTGIGMFNDDIQDLYRRVRIGAEIVVE